MKINKPVYSTNYYSIRLIDKGPFALEVIFNDRLIDQQKMSLAFFMVFNIHARPNMIIQLK